MTNEDAEEIAELEAKLEMAERELGAWERNGSQEKIKMGRLFVQTLREQLHALRQRPHA